MSPAASASHNRAARPQPRQAPLRAVPKAIERTGNAVFAMVCMGLLAAGLLVLLLLNTALAQGAFTLQQLTATSGTLADEQHELRQSIEAQSNSAALAQRAAQLGMVPAKSMAFLRLSDGAVIGVADPAKPEPLIVVTTPRPAPSPTATATAPLPEATATAPAPEGAAPAAPPATAEPTQPTAAQPAAPAPAAAAPAPAAPAAPATGGAP